MTIRTEFTNQERLLQKMYSSAREKDKIVAKEKNDTEDEYIKAVNANVKCALEKMEKVLSDNEQNDDQEEFLEIVNNINDDDDDDTINIWIHIFNGNRYSERTLDMFLIGPYVKTPQNLLIKMMMKFS
ncbi:uncharacterized protein OCT59_024097 [Rhizophagus irregularis]|uniref:uncharacterized protein n=1 Tax=Rhizophagus irregularis TaxID=588596 RepID=UPI00331B3CA4|nr:hypothetical protein OCT59_024097 [Rhizophagus irregularis]